MTHQGPLHPEEAPRSPAELLCRPAESFGFRLWHVTHAWQRRLETALAPLDLTHLQFVMLAATNWLSRQGETPSQTRIAGFTGIDRMMVSKILRLLEGKGYLIRDRHPDDPRANRVDLSPAGQAALAEAIPVTRATQEAFFGRLSPEGREALAAQLDALLALEGHTL
jgi:MarR family transcriptional regulator, organic hydroperoxide resistance regulator